MTAFRCLQEGGFRSVTIWSQTAGSLLQDKPLCSEGHLAGRGPAACSWPYTWVGRIKSDSMDRG